MVGTSHPQALEVRIFNGPGSRQNRVHVFDQRTGSYLTRGFTRGEVLFVRRPIDGADIVIRAFEGRRKHTAEDLPTGRSPRRRPSCPRR